MNVIENQCMKKAKKVLNDFIEIYGMQNGYNTSFGNTIILESVFSGIELIVNKTDITIDKLHDISFQLYNDLYECFKPIFKPNTYIRLKSTHIENGCYAHYLEIIEREMI